MAPVDRRAQRLLAWQRGAIAAGEQCKAIVQPFGDLFDPRSFDPSRRQFQRQRNPSSWRQMRATAAEFSAVSRNDGEANAARATNRRTAEYCKRARSPDSRAAASGVGNGGMRHANSPAISNASRLLARMRSPCWRQRRRGETGTGFDQVFAVVEDEQEISAAQELQEGMEQRPARFLVHAQNFGDGASHECRIAHGRATR